MKNQKMYEADDKMISIIRDNYNILPIKHLLSFSFLCIFVEYDVFLLYTKKTSLSWTDFTTYMNDICFSFTHIQIVNSLQFVHF